MNKRAKKAGVDSAEKKSARSKKKKSTTTESGAKRILTALIFTVLACVCVLVGIKAVDFTFEPETDLTGNTGFIDSHEDETGEDEQSHNSAVLTELRDVDGLSSLLKTWAQNDEAQKIHEKGIINFLLIGIDASASGGYGNSDAIILVSVNTKKSEIKMVSFYRDSYTYIASEYGDRYAKINASYANGGAALLVKTVEDDYKIKIDYYASVNFETFVEVVDLLGGVRLNVPQYVANYIASAWHVSCPAGDNILLDGNQALRFVRARHCDTDSDVSRTRRQREFITSLISAAKGIQLSKVDDMLKIFSKYVKTDCPNATILSLASQALREKWYDYNIKSSSMPTEDYRMDYRGFSWVWIVDYPGAAQELQKQLYGYSDFTIPDGTQTAIDMMKAVA